MTHVFPENDMPRLRRWFMHSRRLPNAQGHPGPTVPSEPTQEFGEWMRRLPRDFRALSRQDVEFLRGSELPPRFPASLLVKGNIAVLARPCVAIVGSRSPTLYGRRIAQRFASALAARGVTILSGGAIGIDGIANRAALANGFSCAVVGGGLLHPHPRTHHGLFEEMALSGRGLVLSQFREDEAARPWHFPVRNHTLALLADFILVVEASPRSGSLITAGAALEHGIDLGALPGDVESPLSAGTNALIADGAFCIRAPEEILERLASLRRLRADRVRLFADGASDEAEKGSPRVAEPRT